MQLEDRRRLDEGTQVEVKSLRKAPKKKMAKPPAPVITAEVGDAVILGWEGNPVRLTLVSGHSPAREHFSSSVPVGSELGRQLKGRKVGDVVQLVTGGCLPKPHGRRVIFRVQKVTRVRKRQK